MKHILWMSLGGLFAGVGTVGIVVPLLPTTPLYLLALWAYFKASPRHARRLLRHPRYGPVLRAWVRHKAIPLKAKLLATFLLALSWITLFLGGMPLRIIAFPSLLFAGVAAFVWSRPVTQVTS
jgi:uncharacterized membrane protein YbaN (DUF454 family)